MAGISLYGLLLDLGYEKYIESFEAKQVVTVADLKNLSYSNVKNILPGQLVEDFWNSHQTYFIKQCESASTAPTASNTNSTIPSNSGVKEALPSSRSPLQEINGNERVNHIFITENINVRQILEDCFEGSNVLTWYSNKGCLNVTKRKKVVHHVMCATLRLVKSIRELEEPDFMILRRKIVEVFPTEIASIYYSPSIPKTKALNGVAQRATGRLLHKYNNLRRLPTGVILPYAEEQTTSADSDEDIPTDEVQASLDWLRNLEEPWDTAKNHWKTTFNYRHPNEEIKSNKRVGSLFELWPILKNPRAYELIEIDFNLSGICNVDNSINNFSDFFLKISQCRPPPKDELCITLRELLEKENFTEDSKFFIELIQLSFMFASNARIPQGKRKYWKPSCIESFEGIITHVKNYGEIQRTKEDRRTFAASKNITVQPYVIGVGEDDFRIESSYVIIDDTEYPMPTLTEAVDCVFKSFHVFSAKYPPQSQHLWLLLQHGLYRFRTRWDPVALNVDELLNDINLILPALK